MGFKGKFELHPQSRLVGSLMYSFVLKNTSFFGSDTFDCMISDEFGQQPFYFRGITLKAGKSLRFDFDTENWQWCQHDFFAILGKNDKILQKWQLNLKEYGPGECPDCHGTKQCRKCHGEGVSFSFEGGIKTCPACGGTGVCQTCEIPRRNPIIGGGPMGLKPF